MEFLWRGESEDNLVTEIHRLREANQQLLTALKDMLFAYTNKDGEFPHGFETEAVEAAEKIIAKVEKN